MNLKKFIWHQYYITSCTWTNTMICVPGICSGLYWVWEANVTGKLCTLGRWMWMNLSRVTQATFTTDLRKNHYSDVIIGTMASQITSLTIVYWTVYLCADQRKHQSFASLAFVQGIHWWPVNSPHKWPVTRKMFPFDDVIMIHSWGKKCFALINSQVDLTNQRARWKFRGLYQWKDKRYLLWNDQKYKFGNNKSYYYKSVCISRQIFILRNL